MSEQRSFQLSERILFTTPLIVAAVFSALPSTICFLPSGLPGSLMIRVFFLPRLSTSNRAVLLVYKNVIP